MRATFLCLCLAATAALASPARADGGIDAGPAVRGGPVFSYRHRGDLPRGDGREEAARACQSADFDSDKRRCIEIVGRASFFDKEAARACARMMFSSGVPACVAAISDKRYLSAEVELCSGNSFDSGKVACFRSSGKAYGQYPDYPRRPDQDSYILRKLRGIRRSLDSGDVAGALFDLSDLIRFVEHGMRE